MSEPLKYKDFRFAPLCLEELLPLVMNQLGYPAGQAVKEQIWVQIREVAEYGLLQIQPQSLYKFTPFLYCEKGRLAGRDIEIRSKHWTNLVRQCTAPQVLCCFIVTLGKDFDKALTELQEKALFQAYVLDALGSVAVEQLVEQIGEYLAGVMAEQSCQTTARFSPGYCDWPVDVGQSALFAFLKPEKIGVEITSAAMMTPRKSISAVMVAAQEVPWKTPCRFCTKKDCSYRRERQQAR